MSSVVNLAKELKALKEEKQQQKSQISNEDEIVQQPLKAKEKPWSNPETTRKKLLNQTLLSAYRTLMVQMLMLAKYQRLLRLMGYK